MLVYDWSMTSVKCQYAKLTVWLLYPRKVSSPNQHSGMQNQPPSRTRIMNLMIATKSPQPTLSGPIIIEHIARLSLYVVHD
jgi:hypothetical protein